MSIADLRTKSIEELQTELASTRASLAESRRMRAMNELANSSTIAKQRRTIAHILTVLSEKALTEGKEA